MSNWSGNPYIDSLLLGWKWNTSNLTYRFDTSSGTWSTIEKAALRNALQSWSNVANVRFTEVATGGNLVEGHYRGSAGDLGYHQTYENYSSSTIASYGGTLSGAFNYDGYGWDEGLANGGLSIGGLGYLTLVHEIGHALGLDHTHSDAGDPHSFPGVDLSPFSDRGDNLLNQDIYSVMSYVHGYTSKPLTGTAGGDNYGFVAGPMAFDIAAIQFLYGANTTYRTSSDTYILPTTNAAGTYYTCIWDADGIDTIVHNGTAAATIDLRAATLNNEVGGGGFLSRVNGIYGGFTIANGVIIENATGGSGGDTLYGNASANLLMGGIGSDTVYGNSGNDVIWGSSSDPTFHGISIIGTLTNDGGDTLYGDDGNDWMNGNQGADTLDGGTGNDTVSGGRDNDLVMGGIGADTLYGSQGDDTIWGSSSDPTFHGMPVPGTQTDDGADLIFADDGNDWINGNQGNDTIDGGVGNDVVSGGRDNDIVMGGLGSDTVYGSLGDDVIWGSSSDPTYHGVAIVGTLTDDGADVIFGDDGNDWINGNQGNDTIYAGDGNDTLSGGRGDDYLTGDAGNDELSGSDGYDSACYSGSMSAYVVTSFQNGNWVIFDIATGYTDTLISIERVTFNNGYLS